MSDHKIGSKSSVASIGELEWEVDVPVATHPLMLLNFGKVIIIASVLLGALIAFQLAMAGDHSAILPLIEMLAACSTGLFLLVIVVALVFYRNRMPMRFRVDAAGASASVIDRRARIVSKVAIATGLLTGKPGVAGAGMISANTSKQEILWEAIARARFHPRWRTISLANSWRTVLVLFCRDDNYDAVTSTVRRAIDAHLVEQPARNSPLASLLLRSALAVIATIPLFYLPYYLTVGLIAPLLVLCFALATIWLVPLLAWVVIATLAYVGVAVLLNRLTPTIPLFGEGLHPAYRVLSDDDWTVLVLAFFGAGYLLWLSIAALNGRIRSALMSD